MIEKLVCVNCQREFPIDGDAQRVWMTCPDCGAADGILDFRYDLNAVHRAWDAAPLSGRPLDHWRYAELLPLDPRAIRYDWQVGWTPLIDARRLASDLGIRQVVLKDEGRNP